MTNRPTTRPESPEGLPEPAALLVRSLEERRQTFDTQWKRCRRRCSENSIHDLRVATRRLIVTLDIVQTVFPDSRLAKTRRTLKKHLKAFSPLRDLHIELVQANNLLTAFPQLRPFRLMLMLREARLVKQAGKYIGKMRMMELEESIGFASMQVPLLFSRPETRSAGCFAIVGAMASAFTRVANMRARVSPTDTRSIHRLRVAFKRYRYMTEVLQPMLSGMTRARFKAMNSYQVRMGDVQDTEVFLGALNEYMQRRRAPVSDAFVPVRQELARRRAMLIGEFMQSADELFDFWAGAVRLGGGKKP